MRVEPLYLQSPPKVMCTLEPFYWCIASDTEDSDEWQLNWTKQWWDICFRFWMWGLSLTLEELFSDSCEQGQDFKRVYSTFSCHLERNIESSMPKLEGETGFPASRCHLIRFMVGTKGLASRTPVPWSKLHHKHYTACWGLAMMTYWSLLLSLSVFHMCLWRIYAFLIWCCMCSVASGYLPAETLTCEWTIEYRITIEISRMSEAVRVLFENHCESWENLPCGVPSRLGSLGGLTVLLFFTSKAPLCLYSGLWPCDIRGQIPRVLEIRRKIWKIASNHPGSWKEMLSTFAVYSFRVMKQPLLWAFVLGCWAHGSCPSTRVLRLVSFC